MKLDQKLDLCQAKAGEPSGIFPIRIRRYCKNLEVFMACVFFSISS